MSSLPSPVEALDLTGFTLSCRFDAFGARNMTALLALGPNSEVSYSGGIDAAKPVSFEHAFDRRMDRF